MLDLDKNLRRVQGYTVFRDFADPNQWYFLPSGQARIANNGKALQFVAYSEDITTDPNFEDGSDRSGGFLTMSVELGPNESEEAALISAIRQEVGGNARVSMVPFHAGSVKLVTLSQTGAAGGGDTDKSWKVSVSGSAKPSLWGKQTASFSTRLGGKAANVLWETLRRSGDAQSVVLYELKFRGVQPSYNLEIEIDFSKTYDFIQHQVGLNTPFVSADLDFLIQESVNSGTITVKEVDYRTGDTSKEAPLGDDVLKIVRELLSPALFNPAPVPSQQYRALPNAATNALNASFSGNTTNTNRGSASNTGGNSPAPQNASAHGIKVEHTPVTGNRAVGEVDIIAKVTTTLASPAVLLKYRNSDSGDFQNVEMTKSGDNWSGDIPTGDNGIADGKTIQYYIEATAGPTDARKTTRLPEGDGLQSFTIGAMSVNQHGLEVSHTPIRDGVAAGAIDVTVAVTGSAPPTAVIAKYRTGGSGEFSALTLEKQGDTTDYKKEVPADTATNGTTIEYFVEVKKGDDTVRLPAGEGNLSFRVGSPGTSSSSNPITAGGGTASGGTAASNNSNDNSGNTSSSGSNSSRGAADFFANSRVGYSMRMEERIERVTRTFTLTKAQAAERSYNPAGLISKASAGPGFDATTQVTHVQLGQGPFKVIQIAAQLGFDPTPWKVRTVTVHIDYDKSDDAVDGYSQSVDITLGKVVDASGNETTRRGGKVQFFADNDGTQAFQYYVKWVLEPDAILGGVPQTAIQSRTITTTERSITVNFDEHLPLIPVEVTPGVLKLSEDGVKQVQVRVQSKSGNESRVVMLRPGPNGELPATERLHVCPANATSRSFDVQTTYFIGDDQVVINEANRTDSQLVINEPPDRTLRIAPELDDSRGLLKRVRIEASYTRASGGVEQQVIELTPDKPKGEWLVVRAPGDPNEWRGKPLFQFKDTNKPSLSGPATKYAISSPIVSLQNSGFRVVRVLLVNDTASLYTNGLLALEVTLGLGVTTAGQPVTRFLFRGTTNEQTVIVPGIQANTAVPIRIRELRSGGTARADIVGTIEPGASEHYLVVAS